MPTPFERSEETNRLVNHLRSLDKGTTITYDELSRIVDRRVTSRDASRPITDGYPH